MSEALADFREDTVVDMEWQSVCQLEDIAPDTGLCALLGKRQVALFRERRSNAVYAISNFDPFGEANVLSRGIIGSIGERLVVASPLYKQHFDLRTGECLEDDSVVLDTYAVRVVDGLVQLRRRN